jgi:predicted transcriptional regulator
MTKKEYILDSLINDDEAFTQIVEYFKFVNVRISNMELEQLLKEMIEEGFIRVNYQWKNEKDEYPYSLTRKGIKVWLNIKQSDNIID